MSGLVSAIGKSFIRITSGIGRLGSAITGVGATAFTGAAATGSLSSAISGFSSGGGVLSSILQGVGTVLGAPSAIAQGVGSAVGAAPGAIGGLAPSVSGLTGAAETATGMAATGRTGFNGILDMLGGKEGIGYLLAGAGKAYGDQQTLDAAKERDEALYAFKDRQEQRLRDSYAGAGQAVAGATPFAPDKTLRLPPGQAWNRAFNYEVQPGPDGKPIIRRVGLV